MIDFKSEMSLTALMTLTLNGHAADQQLRHVPTLLRVFGSVQTSSHLKIAHGRKPLFIGMHVRVAGSSMYLRAWRTLSTSLPPSHAQHRERSRCATSAFPSRRRAVTETVRSAICWYLPTQPRMTSPGKVFVNVRQRRRAFHYPFTISRQWAHLIITHALLKIKQASSRKNFNPIFLSSGDSVSHEREGA
ncbi:hypothetical protein F4778DRAFT_754546 [Xylariomycetidae sp. FL2044]|nr:hypothetical protein F4778DRAFT_754546 [Xylariomycetidae sp. FL2044]